MNRNECILFLDYHIKFSTVIVIRTANLQNICINKQCIKCFQRKIFKTIQT